MAGLELISPKRIEERDQRQYSAISLIPVEDSLSAHIKRHWEINKRHKERVENRLDLCYRARAGEYDPETLQAIREVGGSEVYLMLSAAKMRALSAWITDIMLPANDRPWDLEPTPIPDMPEDILSETNKIAAQEAAKIISNMIMNGKQPSRKEITELTERIKDDLTEELEKEVKDEARKAIDRMIKKIEDQLSDGDFYDAMESFIEDFCTYPVAILKGPIPTSKNSLRWEDGRLVVDQRMSWRFERVSPYDIYPSPGAAKIDDGHLIEHLRLSHSTLYDLMDIEGYRKDKIREALGRVTELGGLGTSTGWLAFQNQNLEQQQALSSSTNTLTTDNGLVDALHYWGAVPGKYLREWGMNEQDIPDPDKSYQVDAILVDNIVIRAVLNDDPLFRRPYSKASFQNVPGDFYGIAMAETMEDVQRMANAATRALANNMSFASGPQVGVDVDSMDDPSEADSIYPLKVWALKKDPFNARTKIPIEFFQPSSNAGELLPVIREFEQKADEVTGVPKYASGNTDIGGAGRTARGLTLLMESAAKGVRKAIMNIDRGTIRRIIKMMWYNNMVFDDDDSIKGDAKVIARGATALIAKDSVQAKRAELLQMTSNPTDMELIGLDSRAKLLHSMYVEAGLGDVLPPVNEMVKRIERKQEEQKEAAKQQDPFAKAELEKAQAETEVSKAKAIKELSEAMDANPALKASLLALISQLGAENERTEAQAGPGIQRYS